MALKKEIESVKKAFFQQLQSAQTEQVLETIRVDFLGRKGQVAQLMKVLKELSVEEKRLLGPALNELKNEIESAFEERQQEVQKGTLQALQAKKEQFDVTAYKPHQLQASLHPYTHITQLIEDIFISMGFELADGPEVETDYYNFQALNIPADHPARDMQDTFWLDIPNLLLRTHTSTVQIHTMQSQKPPLAIFAHGRTYRHEATDASHDFMFMQTEGLLIDKNITMGHLLATAKNFLQALFDQKDLDIRVRPGYFPFVEPGVEIEMSCPFCTHGCSVCKKSRWIEICGAGLVHPNVLKYGGIDPRIYSGFAFGFGLTRLAMLKYKINDVRLLSSVKLDFLNQF